MRRSRKNPTVEVPDQSDPVGMAGRYLSTKDRAEAKALQGAPPIAKVSKMRTFVLDRADDLTGTSGVGIVAEGVQFSSGQVALHWLSQLEAVNVYGNALVLETLHGHGGGTRVVWQQPPPLSDLLKQVIVAGVAGSPIDLSRQQTIDLSKELRLLLGVSS